MLGLAVWSVKPTRLTTPRQKKGTHTKVNTRATRRDPALASDAEEILARVRALWRGLLRNPYADADEHGVTGPQVTVMACLVSRGPMALTELSRTLGMSHSSASGIVDRLQARGLVRRTEDASDRRRRAIAVTEGVRRYVRELEEGPSARLARALETATPAQRAAVRKGLKLLCELVGTSR
jgi:MarR family transcriptional regulator, organic hydroperoxide resistance regulator